MRWVQGHENQEELRPQRRMAKKAEQVREREGKEVMIKMELKGTKDRSDPLQRKRSDGENAERAKQKATHTHTQKGGKQRQTNKQKE